MQRLLVIGGAGLPGSHLVDRLLADGHEVIAIDDLSRGSFANLAHLKRNPRFVFREHDVVVPFRAEVDRIFHLAMPSTRRACEADPVKAALTCVTGTLHALGVAAANRARVVMATATERWGEGVRCAESLALDFARLHDLDVRIVRLPSAYGPRMAPDGDHPLTSLVLQGLRGEELVAGVRLEGRLRLCYVDDVVETLVRTMASEPHTPVLVAPSSEASVLELARMIAEAAGRASAAVGEGAPEGPASTPSAPRFSMPAQAAPQPASWRPALVHAVPASLALGLVPKVHFAEGLARTVAWFEGRRAGRRVEERRSGVYAPAREAAVSPTPATHRAG